MSDGPGGPGTPPPKEYSAGRKLRGVSVEKASETNNIAGLKRGQPTDPGPKLSSPQLYSIALELGFSWSDFGISDPSDPTMLSPRPATDAEALFLQVPARIPLGFYGTFIGATAPALFWSDLSYLYPRDVPTMEVYDALPIWWQAVHLVRDPAACQLVIGEPASLVLGGRGFDGKDYEISLAPGSIGAAFNWAPRALVMAPKVEFDDQKHYREIVGFGFSHCLFFSRIHLRGGVSGSLYGVERLPMSKGTAN